MFTKPYKVKSHNTLKNTERKQLIRLAVERLPTSEQNMRQLFPSGAPVTSARLSSGVAVYAAEGHPAILETEEALIPALPALWTVPDLLPTITVHDAVLPRNGAPLYLPGVRGTTNRDKFPKFERGALLSINTESNKAAGAVGRAVMSSGQMMLGTSGVAVEVLHIVGDHLCRDAKYTKIERPHLEPPTSDTSNTSVGDLAANIDQLTIHPKAVEEWPSLGSSRQKRPVNQPQVIPDSPEAQPDTEIPEDVPEDVGAEQNTTVDEESTEDSIPSNMDDLLRHCLLSFIKLQGKKVELPLKTNLLYKNHLMPYCPAGRLLDVKKSSYKKMSKFMEAMQKEGLVEVRELERGVDAVVGLAVEHLALRGHVAVCPPPAPAPSTTAGPVPPTVRELLCVTAAVVPLFPGLRKGTALPHGEVRAALTLHVKTHNLAGPAGVSLDTTLASILGKPEQAIVRWDELMSCVERRMTASTELRFPDGRVTSFKSKLEPVTMQVLTRSGNKKVTLVSNLEQFGFNLQELSRSCQAGVAASCGVTRAPGAKRDQLMLQGDQTYYIAKLLTETYSLPKKFVEGADKALKKKNK